MESLSNRTDSPTLEVTSRLRSTSVAQHGETPRAGENHSVTVSVTLVDPPECDTFRYP
jgi:hypothetical protein